MEYNKIMKLKDICDNVNIEYNIKNPSRSLRDLRYEYEVEQISKQKFKVIRELEPEEKAVSRYYSQCKQQLEPVIYCELSKSKDIKISKDMKGLFELFHITNENYKYFSYSDITKKKYTLIENMDFEYEPEYTNKILSNFVTDVNSVLRRVVIETLKKMVDESYILVEEKIILAKREVESIGVNEDGTHKNIYIVNKHEATDKEKKDFIELRRKYMDEIEKNKWSDVNYYDKIKIEENVLRDMNVTYSYIQYNIIINKDGLQRTVELNKLDKIQDELNASIAEKVKRSKNGELKKMDEDDKDKCINNLIVRKNK